MSAKKSGFRGTWIMAVLVAALAGYTYWEYKKSASPDKKNPEEKSLFTFKNEEINEVKLTRPNEVIDIVRDGDKWQMKKPMEDLVDRSAMDSFLYSLTARKGKVFPRDNKGPIKWSDYGLEPPGLTVEFKAGARTESLAFGSKNAFDGSYYLRQGDEIYLGETGFAGPYRRDVNSFRSKQLWREDDDVTVDSADVQVNADIKAKYRIKKADGKWTITPTPKFAVDNDKVDKWVQAIEEFRPSDIAAEDLSGSVKHDDLLLKPSLVVTLHFKRKDGKEAEWKLTAGQDKSDDLYLYTDQRPTVYKTHKTGLNQIRVGLEYFRDGKEPFRFPLEQATEVEVDSGAFKHTFKKEGSQWKLADKDQSLEVDSTKLEDFFHNLSKIEAYEYVPMSQAKGFKADQHVVVKDGKGQTLLDLSWGDEYKTKLPYNVGRTLRYAKTNHEKQALGVGAYQVTSLIDTSIVKKNAEKKK